MSLNAATIEYLLGKGLTGDDLLAVAQRMERRSDPTAAERMARHRANRATRNVTRNAPPIEEDHTPPKITPTKPNGLEPAPKKHRLPVNWEPRPFTPGSLAAQVIARWEPGRMERELSKFRDHHTAAGSRFECWQAAWGKWTNNSEDFQRGRHGGQQQPSGIGTTERAMQKALASVEGRGAGASFAS